MSKSIIYFLLAACIYASAVDAIFYGRIASKSSISYPYLVSLRNSSNKHLSVGTIISQRHVITDSSETPNNVEVGMVVLGKGTSFKVANVSRHPNMDDKTHSYQIALITITGNFKFNDYVQPAVLGTIPIPGGVPLQVASWGTTEFKEGPTDLRLATFVTLSDEQCKQKLAAINWTDRWTENKMCAFGYRKVEKTCFFDQGTPWVAGGLVVGITRNPADCKSNPSGINLAYRIVDFLPWINELIAE